MSVIQGFKSLTYCRLKVLKLANLPTPLSNITRSMSVMSTDVPKAGQFDVVHDSKESEFFIWLGDGR